MPILCATKTSKPAYYNLLGGPIKVQVLLLLSCIRKAWSEIKGIGNKFSVGPDFLWWIFFVKNSSSLFVK